MKIFKGFFNKKKEENADLLKKIRMEISSRALYEMHIIRSSAEEEASKIMEWCRISEKKENAADYMDAAVVIISYSPEFGLSVFQEMKKMSGLKAGIFEDNIFKVIGKIDILYEENEHIIGLKAKRAEIYYILGKGSSHRIKKSAQLLAAAIMSSGSIDEARAFYARRTDFSEEVLRQFEEELKKYDERVIKEIKEE